MGREPTPKPGRILYIGRVDTAHDVFWQQLQREGIDVVFAATQKAGLEQGAQIQPRLVVINATESAFSADRMCRLLARRLPNARRLVLLDQKAGRQVVCDQSLVRPFTLQKLRRTVISLIGDASPYEIQAGPLRLDLVGKTITGPAGHHHLTPKQCSLLAFFLERPNQVVSRRDLMDQIWDTDYLGDTRTLDVHIRWLREKIEPDPKHPVLLLTHRGVGYTLALETESADGYKMPDELTEVLD